MVRVGGGWMALDEFLVKNDPCRGNFSNKFQVKNEYYLGSRSLENFRFSLLSDLIDGLRGASG